MEAMDRRRFLQGLAVASAAMNALPAVAKGKAEPSGSASPVPGLGAIEMDAVELDVEGHTLICTFDAGATKWKVYEDLRSREGAITLVASTGGGHVLAKSAEANYPDANPPYLGLKLADIGMAGPDLLADRLLRDGDPDAELLQADMLPPGLANTVIDCMRAYGATTLGVVANVERPHAEGRDILGFISYGYAQMLLRLDRIEEYLLFLYSHQYHDHTRGSWTAGEVSGITGDTALFCIPAQQTIPLLVRWMLVLEDSDEDRLYLGKGLPREWIASGKTIQIEQAPTRWGRVSFKMAADGKGRLNSTVELHSNSGLKVLQVKLRLPKQHTLKTVTVNGKPAEVGGLHKDTVSIATADQTRFEVVGEFA